MTVEAEKSEERTEKRRAAKRIGFIGLGVMGSAMASNLLRAGHELHVWARRPEALEPLVAAGARPHATAAELASACEVAITMVTATRDVEEVLTGPGGVIEGAARGTVVIDMSTIAPDGARRLAATLAERGILMLDAPVSGGPSGARNATLTIMVGGSEEVLSRVRPILEALGRQIVHLGGHGAGQVAKACAQLALLVNAEGAAEALALGTRLGLNPARLREALLGGLAASRVLEVFGERMVARDFEPGIESRLYDKDLTVALELARGAGVRVPAAAVVRERLDEIMRQGGGERDLSQLIELVEREGRSHEEG